MCVKAAANADELSCLADDEDYRRNVHLDIYGRDQSLKDVKITLDQRLQLKGFKMLAYIDRRTHVIEKLLDYTNMKVNQVAQPKNSFDPPRMLRFITITETDR